MTIYRFGSKQTDGSILAKDLLGGKGANLAEMALLGINVPPGFTIPTTDCMTYLGLQTGAERKAFMTKLMKEVRQELKFLKKCYFGHTPLVSVRSGARVSMPGMMDTVLNVGITPKNYMEWSGRLGETVSDNCVNRLVSMYSDVVRKKIPFDNMKQIRECIEAVFKSWNTDRAETYRKMYNIPEDWGTAVNVQSMVFGNNENSGTGVVFSRDPATGEKKITGEFLINAQGEDVVAGTVTPMDISQLEKWDSALSKELFDTVDKLEKHYKDVQDIEFTIQNKQLFILQTRNAKRSAVATFRTALEMYKEGIIDFDTMKSRLKYSDFIKLRSTTIDSSEKGLKVDCVGIPAGGSIVCGRVVKSSEKAVSESANGPVILVSKETTPEDIKGMAASVGILTTTGGKTSHAAVVARGMNKTCVTGCTDLNLAVIVEGSWVTIDGHTGNVYLRHVKLKEGEITGSVKEAISLLARDRDIMLIGAKAGFVSGATVYLQTCDYEKWIGPSPSTFYGFDETAFRKDLDELVAIGCKIVVDPVTSKLDKMSQASKDFMNHVSGSEYHWNLVKHNLEQIKLNILLKYKENVVIDVPETVLAAGSFGDLKVLYRVGAQSSWMAKLEKLVAAQGDTLIMITEAGAAKKRSLASLPGVLRAHLRQVYLPITLDEFMHTRLSI